MTKPQIIGISGITAAGKTSLSHSLARDLQATIVGWDDFDSISQGPGDYVDWYNRGENYSEWNYSALENVLQTLIHQKSLIHPVIETTLTPTKYIVFDAPLGRLHEQTGQYIDICFHIELPLDVSLGRRLLRDFKTRDKTKEELLSEIEFYLSHSRPLFFDDKLKQRADFIIDGMPSTDMQMQEIKAYLSERKNEK